MLGEIPVDAAMSAHWKLLVGEVLPTLPDGLMNYVFDGNRRSGRFGEGLGRSGSEGRVGQVRGLVNDQSIGNEQVLELAAPERCDAGEQLGDAVGAVS